MKRILCFFILFLPWLFSIFFIFSLNITYSLISIIFYLLFTLYIYKITKNNTYNNKLLYLSLFYIINQCFNIVLFQYTNIYLKIFLGFFMIILLFKIIKNT